MMSQPAPQPSSAPTVAMPPPSDDALLDLERLLELEAGFLARLELAGIDAIVERKEQLLGRLVGLVPTAAERPRLERIRARAISNQLLTVHARDAIASIVFSAAPANSTTYSPNERSVLRPGARLSVRV
jgi:hypothetical protein